MAAPPPQDDDTGQGAIAFGIAAVDEVLEDTELTFPVERRTLVERLGDREIPYDARGRTMTFSDALAETDQSSFETRRELLNALHPIFEEHRDPGGVGSWLRTILPF